MVSAHQLAAYSKSGGLVALMRVGGRTVGFISSLCGQHEGELILWSDMMGFLPEMRGRARGEQMKRFQREWALQQGMRRIHWTFDPLETANARLNITKLGGVVRRYVRDFYGNLQGTLTGGLPTDRFVLEWELEAALAPQPVPERVVGHGETPGSEAIVGVQVPLNLQQLKREAPEEAMRWRLHTRSVFETLLERGLEVRHFVVNRDHGIYIASGGR